MRPVLELPNVNGILDDVFVLHARKLRPGVNLVDTARFSDASWPLYPATIQGQERGLVLHFENVPVQHRECLKRLIYAFLAGPPPQDESQPSISSLTSSFYNVSVFLRWLDQYQEGLRVRDVDTGILLAFNRHLLSTYRSAARRTSLRGAMTFLWRYRRILKGDSLPLDPRTVAGWSEARGGNGGSSTENTTPRIPEEVHSRVLVWALRFVDDFSDDILDAVNRWEMLRSRHTERIGWGQARFMIDKFLENAVSNGVPLPSINGILSENSLARAVGCDRGSLRQREAAITNAASIVGLSEYTYLGLDIVGRIDGEPWIPGVCLDPVEDYSITVLTQMLQAACYIVIAFLSGMRDSEIKHLRTGCCSAELDTSGRPYRWRVSSMAFKGELTESGVQATWVVGAPAARAISILERVHRERAHGRSDWLFSWIKSGPGTGSAGRNGNLALTIAGTNRQLNRFITWVNTYCAVHGRIDSIPDVNGKPWKLSTRQFRRTLAWYIARQPGGSIAGAIAYRHHSIQMFEGYAGTSASGFRGEVEAEEALARGEKYLAMINLNDHDRLLGPAAAEAERRLSDWQGRPGFIGTVTTDRHRFLRLVQVNGPKIYPSPYITCVYDPKKALCRTDDGTSESHPDITRCQPLSCHNVAATQEQLRTWKEEVVTIDAELAERPLLPPLLVARLIERKVDIISFIDRNEDKE